MKLILALALALLLTSATFNAFPALDLATSRLFYDGTSFPVTHISAVEALRVAMWSAEDAGFLLALAFTLRGRTTLNLTRRDWLFQALVFALGPGLIVNGILKRLWGRARPFQTTEFGGTAHFSPAWTISDQCSGNCSFVSGEMAGATALAICFSLTLCANRTRLGPGLTRTGFGLAAALPLVTAWQRVAVGRHYLSDVLIAFILVALVAALLRHTLYKASPIKRC